jgi:hypothetical protein
LQLDEKRNDTRLPLGHLATKIDGYLTSRSPPKPLQFPVISPLSPLTSGTRPSTFPSLGRAYFPIGFRLVTELRLALMPQRADRGSRAAQTDCFA